MDVSDDDISRFESLLHAREWTIGLDGRVPRIMKSCCAIMPP